MSVLGDTSDGKFELCGRSYRFGDQNFQSSFLNEQVRGVYIINNAFYSSLLAVETGSHGGSKLNVEFGDRSQVFSRGNGKFINRTLPGGGVELSHRHSE